MRLLPRAGALTTSAFLLQAVLGACPLAAQLTKSAPAITAAEIDGDLRFLSSDLLEGRAPGTRGGRLAEEYIAGRLLAAGIRPGNDTSFFQDVPIELCSVDQGSVRVQAGGKATVRLHTPDDVVVWPGSALPRTSAQAEVVFAGYGIHAPEYRWDDFKGVDLRGKILLVLVNDPPAPASEPTLFGGKAMTYYGRWTYKFEEAERRGALGAFVIHRTAEASYPWHTVVGSWTTTQRSLPRDPAVPPPLAFRGWITDSAATALLAQAGLDLAKLRTLAESRSFKPIATGITLDVGFQSRVERLASRNVLGLVPGSDPALQDTYVVYTAHWDHLGIGPAVDGDSIYHGAADNASGVADLLAVARAARAAPPTRRTQLFVFVTGEESGLLGSAYFAHHPTVPASRIVADLNLDGGNLLGPVRDLTATGEDRSSLGALLRAYLRPLGLTVSPDAHPEAGGFYRSDHFSFAAVGIPSLSIGAGYDYVGRPAGWGKQQEDEFTARHYHQPSDRYRPGFDLGGAVQLSELFLGFGRELANSASVPQWNAGVEFHRPSVGAP